MNTFGYPIEAESSVSSPFRTYEELIEERGNENYNNYIVSSFDEIKKKLFRYNKESVLLEDHRLKYSIEILNESIHKLKADICKLWNEKIEIHATLNRNKDLFKKFSESILEIIKVLNESTDSELIKLLNKKIDDYAIELNIEYLKLEESRITSEFGYLKKTVKNFSELIPASTCGICYENQVTHFMVNCGHTVCEDCKIKCNTNYCEYCRTPKGEYKKLFYV
jgi:hypothetical protein